jgi:hypothetical protein
LFASVTVNEYVPAVRVNVPTPVKGGVPPPAETVTVDVPPLQAIGVAEAATVNAGEDVTVTDVCFWHPRSSVTVNVCVPALRLYLPMPLYGGFPPLAVTSTVAMLLEQLTVVALENACSSEGSLTFTVVIPLQPFASVTVNVYVPAFLLKFPAPVYGAVPPLAETVTVELPPLQRIGVALAATVMPDTVTFVVHVITCTPSLTLAVSVYAPVVFPASTMTDCPVDDPTMDAPLLLDEMFQLKLNPFNAVPKV